MNPGEALKRWFPWLVEQQEEPPPPKLETFRIGDCSLDVVITDHEPIEELAARHEGIVHVLSAEAGKNHRGGYFLAYFSGDIRAAAWIDQSPMGQRPTTTPLGSAAFMQRVFLGLTVARRFGDLKIQQNIELDAELPLCRYSWKSWPRQGCEPVLEALEMALKDAHAWLERPAREVAVEHLDQLEEALGSTADMPEKMRARMQQTRDQLSRWLVMAGTRREV